MLRNEPTIDLYMTRTVHTIGFDQSLALAEVMMHELKLRHLPVLRGGLIVGVLSDRDLAWMSAVDESTKRRLAVEDAMTIDPYVVGSGALVHDVASAMVAGKFGCVIVAERGRPVGVFTTTDAMRALAAATAPASEVRRSA
jgi:acetoin utilization protein AcuB